MLSMQFGLAAVVATACGTAPAQTTAGATSAGDWQVSAGAAVIATPRAIGSDKTRVLAVPTFDVRYRDWLFIDPIKGFGVQTRPAGGLTASAAFGISLDARRASDDQRLRGLGNVHETPALILGLEYEAGDAFVNTSLRSRLASGHQRGTTLEADLGYNLVATRRALFGAGVSLRAMDGSFARNFLGVTAAQSAASGLPPFSAGGGLQRAGLFGQIVYRVADDWTVFSRVDATRLRGDAARSPVVERRQQLSVVVSALKAF